jgi:hypoxanthine-guanine phosphoribosyltransferase
MPEKLLFNAKEIDAAISVIANKINQDYANNPTPPLILCVMVGGMIFTSQFSFKTNNTGRNGSYTSNQIQ